MTIKTCKCKSEFQDKEYGKQQRVHTEDNSGNHRCTVCGPKARWQQRLDLHGSAHVKQAHG